jgi:hypothetical protein
MKETDLFPPLKEWLENAGYEVFSEVQSYHTGGRADIVATQSPAVTIVEMKVTLSLDLIGQAVRWKPFANYIYVAVPYSRHRYSSDYPCQLLKREGIGLLQVREDTRNGPAVSVLVNPKFHRRINNHMRDSLVEQHKDLPGGHSGRWIRYPVQIDHRSCEGLSEIALHSQNAWLVNNGGYFDTL